MLANIQLISNLYKIVRYVHYNQIEKQRNDVLQDCKISMKMDDDGVDKKEVRLYKMNVLSSHNSYLSNYQNFDFADLSSVEFLIKLGVRCLEFDVYYIGERLVVGHGTKNLFDGYDFISTNVIKLEDIFKLIRDKAFKDFSDYPLIVNLELLVNDNYDAYQKIADKIKKYFYGYVLHSKFHNANINLGNCKMKHLRKKIIFITQKKLLDNNPLAKYINGYTYNLDEIIKMGCDIDNKCIFNLSYREFLENRRMVEEHILKKGLVRVYPNGSFITNFSTNYNFLDVIKSGVQISAINIQQMGNSSKNYIKYFNSPFIVT